MPAVGLGRGHARGWARASNLAVGRPRGGRCLVPSTRHRLECAYRIQVPHRTGQLALVMTAIADGVGLSGDVVTVSVGREHSIREITVEVADNDQATRIAALVGQLDGDRVLRHQDRAMLRHEGGAESPRAPPFGMKLRTCRRNFPRAGGASLTTTPPTTGGQGLEPRFPGPKPGVAASWTTPQTLNRRLRRTESTDRGTAASCELSRCRPDDPLRSSRGRAGRRHPRRGAGHAHALGHAEAASPGLRTTDDRLAGGRRARGGR